MIAVQISTRPILPLLERPLSAYAVMVTCLRLTHTSVLKDTSLKKSLQADMLAANNTTIAINGFGTSVEDFVQQLTCNTACVGVGMSMSIWAVTSLEQ